MKVQIEISDADYYLIKESLPQVVESAVPHKRLVAAIKNGIVIKDEKPTDVKMPKEFAL